MKEKYKILYNNKIIKLKTKRQIKDMFNIDIYLIDKIIKKCNNSNAPISKCHHIYDEIYNNLQIILLKPDLNS